MTPTNILDTALPVTAAQSGVLLAQALDPDNPIYTVAEYVQISGPLDVATFEKALRYVVDTTDALRVFFAEDDGHWQAHVAAHVEWDLRVEDRRDVFEELVGAQQRPIDPTGECLFRFSLFRVDEERWLWFGHYHHALSLIHI